jgi:NAD(P)-dependent dehydrogenase (short-subunit alcohol dehydrogenase family)
MTRASGRFRGRTALVTGGASGMGRASAVAFAAEGASVVVADIDAAGAAETAGLARAAGGRVIFVRTDVSIPAEVEAAVAVAVDEFGGLDAAVNSAAIEQESGPLHECEDGVFDRMVAVNLRGMFLCLKHEITAMLACRSPGAIVNIASVNSFRARARQSVYTTTKHGVLGMTRNAAIEYAPLGIRINAICPGAIDTPMLRQAMARRGRDPEESMRQLSLLGRFGQVGEVANAALWLCSEESSFTIGHALGVDGGMLAR